MKKDFYTNPRQCALRVLNAFVVTLFHMLSTKSYEEITVNDICNNAGYPRATFYNYFNDKNDLLEYFWYRIKEEIRRNTKDEEKSVTGMFIKIFEFLYSKEKRLNQIFKHNNQGGYLLLSGHAYLAAIVKSILYKDRYIYRSELPRELVADYYAQCFLIVLRYRFDGKCKDDLPKVIGILKELIHEEIQDGN